MYKCLEGFGNHGFGNIEPISQLEASHSNHRGDVIARTDHRGSMNWFARYLAYGTRFDEVGATYDRQRANTKEEEDLNLLNEGMRWRDLEHGVWLSLDPIGFGDGPNMYCYVHCNPIMNFDPLGLEIEYLDDSARQIINNVMENGSDQNRETIQAIIDSPHVVTIGTSETAFNGQSLFAPTEPDSAENPELGSGGNINLELQSRDTDFSIESSAAHELHHAHEAINGALTSGDSNDPNDDTDGNGIEDNEDRATAAQRSYQDAAGEEQREDYNDRNTGESDDAFMRRMYPDSFEDYQEKWDEMYESDE